MKDPFYARGAPRIQKLRQTKLSRTQILEKKNKSRLGLFVTCCLVAISPTCPTHPARSHNEPAFPGFGDESRGCRLTGEKGGTMARRQKPEECIYFPFCESLAQMLSKLLTDDEEGEQIILPADAESICAQCHDFLPMPK